MTRSGALRLLVDVAMLNATARNNAFTATSENRLLAGRYAASPLPGDPDAIRQCSAVKTSDEGKRDGHHRRQQQLGSWC